LSTNVRLPDDARLFAKSGTFMCDKARIAQLNDLFRKTMGIGGKVFQTAGICALPENDQSRIREKVELFRDFTEDNDPYGEHAFGAFYHAGQLIYWKIDYYDADMENGSEDPADPRITTRVLTIMLSQEY
jgi:hypothetical protein